MAKSRLSKQDRADFITNATRAAFAARVDNFVKNMGEVMQTRIAELHPAFVRMLKDADLRRYLAVGQDIQMRRADGECYIRLPCWSTIAEFDGWERLTDKRRWGGPARVYWPSASCTYPIHCADSLPVAAPDYLDHEYGQIITEMEKVVGELKTIIYAANYREDIERLAPTLAPYLPVRRAPKITAVAVIPTEAINKLAALGVPPAEGAK